MSTLSTLMNSSGAITINDKAPSTTYYVGLISSATGTLSDLRTDSGNLYYTTADSTLYSTNYNTFSDISLKTNVKRIECPLDTIRRLKGVTFNWVETNDPAIGFIAQDVEKAIPEIVKEIGVRKSINYLSIIPLLVESIKELENRILILESKG